MNLSEGIINETIEYILNTPGIDEETQKEGIFYLKECSINERDIFILKNILFFINTPLIKELYLNDMFIDKFIDLSKDFSRYLFEALIEKLEVKVDIKLFFNNHKLIDRIKTEKYIIDYFMRYPGFLESIDEKYFNELKESIIKSNDIWLYSWLSEDELKNIPKEKYHILFENFKSNWNLLSPGVENFIWSISKDIIKQKSISEKLDYFEKFKDKSLKKEIFNDLDFLDSLDIVIKRLTSNIYEYVDVNYIYDKCLKFAEINNFEYFKLLPPEYQLSAIEVFKEKRIPLSSYSTYIKQGTHKLLCDKGDTSVTSWHDMHELYRNEGDVKYLRGCKNIFLLNKFVNLDTISEEDFVSLLTEEEKSIIAELILNSTLLSLPNKFAIKKYDPYFFNIIKKKMIDEYLNDDTKKMHETLKSIFDFFSEEEYLILLKHVEVGEIVKYAIDSDENLEKILGLLQKDPNLFKENKASKNETFYYNTYADDEYNKRVNIIIKYLSNEQLSIFFTEDALKHNKSLTSEFSKGVENNPEILNRMMLFDYLKEEEIKTALSKISMGTLCNLYNKYCKEEYNKLVIDAIYSRFDELISFINENSKVSIISLTFLKKIYYLFDEEHKKRILNETKYIDEFMAILNESKRIDTDVIDRIIELYELNIYKSKKNILDKKPKIMFDSFDEESKKYFISKLSFPALLYSISYYSSKSIENEILNRINEDNNILLDENNFEFYNEFFVLASDELKETIYKIVDSYIDNNEIYNNIINNSVKNFNYVDKIKYMFLDKKGLIADNLDLCVDLLKDNPFLFKTIGSVIFDEKLKNMDYQFISKLSKYKDIQDSITRIRRNEKLFNLFIELCIYLRNYNYNDDVFNKEISRIIKYLDKKGEIFLNNEDYNLTDIIHFILYDFDITLEITFAEEHETIDGIGYENFEEKKRNKCDELFEEASDIDKMKNIYFNKYFSMSLVEIQKFHKKYVVNYDKVSKYALNKFPLKFIELISRILNIQDPIVLKELYYTTEMYYDLGEIYEIESIMSDAYFESLINDYQNKQNGTPITKKFKDKDGNDVNVEMTELIDNFGIIIHSTCAYGQMPIINDDYFDSWNYNPNTENHGICCCYITNSSYGTPDVTGNGVMLGFTKLVRKSVVAYSPYDLSTYNYGFDITCGYAPFYTLLDEISDYTRHTHNEFSLERRLQDGDFYCVQPDCIIIFEDMDDTIKANSIKAYNDFKAHGVDIKLIYMDRVKIANNEVNKLKVMINEYCNSRDLNILKEIINKYESNICGCDFLSTGNIKSKNLFDMDELFMTDIITKLLFDTLEEINESHNVDRFIYFVSILDNEQYKFDLNDDNNKARKHTFKLYSDELKERIEQVRNNLNIEQREITK